MNFVGKEQSQYLGSWSLQTWRCSVEVQILSSFQNPNLWVQALQWIADQGDDARPEDITEILGMIERHHLMSPLLVGHHW